MFFPYFTFKYMSSKLAAGSLLNDQKLITPYTRDLTINTRSSLLKNVCSVGRRGKLQFSYVEAIKALDRCGLSLLEASRSVHYLVAFNAIWKYMSKSITSDIFQLNASPVRQLI